MAVALVKVPPGVPKLGAGNEQEYVCGTCPLSW